MFKNKKAKSVFVSCCSKNKPEWSMALTIQDAVRECSRSGLNVKFTTRIGESLICRARQNDLTVFMQGSCDYLFSIDDDLTIPADAIVNLVKADKDIIGGVYRIKTDEPRIAMVLPSSGPNWGEVLKKKIVTPAIYVSTGCFLVKRHVVEGMIEKYPELEYSQSLTGSTAWALYQPYVYEREYLSEDWAFCQRARDAGFEIWLHGGVRLGHWGKKLYRFGD